MTLVGCTAELRRHMLLSTEMKAMHEDLSSLPTSTAHLTVHVPHVQMKGEMVQPGAVVYTAALAECRWAGEKRHVDYILEEMKAEGLSIVPGIAYITKTAFQ